MLNLAYFTSFKIYPLNLIKTKIKLICIYIKFKVKFNRSINFKIFKYIVLDKKKIKKVNKY